MLLSAPGILHYYRLLRQTKSMHNKTVAALWQTAYNIFEKRPGTPFKTATGMNEASNHVQFRMMKAISALNSSVTPELIQTIRGDVMVAETMGIFPSKTAEKMQLLLDKLTDVKEK